MKKLFLLTSIVVLTTSCASIVNGTSQMVKINTNEANSKIAIYNKEGKLVSQSTGNFAEKLKRAAGNFDEENYTVKVTSPTGETKEFGINSELSMWFPIGNLGFGGIPGWIIDGFSEAKYKLRTDSGENPSDGINIEF